MRGKLSALAVRRPSRAVASMRPAHCAREVGDAEILKMEPPIASMRPAHCAREVTPAAAPACSAVGCFNEARALCAGSLVITPPSARTSGFNEARALCAGSSSWRPASGRRTSSFNEARALCAGSLVKERTGL